MYPEEWECFGLYLVAKAVRAKGIKDNVLKGVCPEDLEFFWISKGTKGGRAKGIKDNGLKGGCFLRTWSIFGFLRELRGYGLRR